MKIISLSELNVPPRQRSKIDQAAISNLKDSIASKGLFHPPVVSFDVVTSRYNLVAGECRLRAIEALKADGQFFFCNGQPIVDSELPVTLVTELSAVELMEAEFEENYIRVDLTWQDRTNAIAAIHKARLAEVPTQTPTDTARELLDKLPEAQRPRVETMQKKISEATVVAEHLHDPKIAKARNETEAYNLVLQQEAARYSAELIRRRKLAAAESSELEIRCGDSFEILPALDDGKYDLVLTDHPYGSKAGAGGFRGRTVHHHNYEDSPEEAQRTLLLLLREGFRLCKPKANLFVFSDMRNYQFFLDASSRMGWTPWRLPIIWRKSEHEGLAPWGSAGFIHTYDVIFWATKGGKGLSKPILDVIDEKRVSRSARTYAAEKPVPLLKRLIEVTTMPGDYILDPFVGSGSTLVAAKALARNGLGIELDRSAADLAITRLDEGEDSDDDSASVPAADEDDAALPDIPGA